MQQHERAERGQRHLPHRDGRQRRRGEDNSRERHVGTEAEQGVARERGRVLVRRGPFGNKRTTVRRVFHLVAYNTSDNLYQGELQ